MLDQRDGNRAAPGAGSSADPPAPGLLAFALLALCLPAAAAGAADYWIADPATGCAVWSDEPAEPNEVIKWSGGCADGKAVGPGILEVLEDGEPAARFEVTMAAGKAQGFGLLETSTADGQLRYEGEMVDSRLRGSGILTLPDGSRYEGTFADDLPSGWGAYSGADGSYYQGGLKAGKPHGYGHLRTADGEIYRGELEDGERHGLGTLVTAEGVVYLGQFAGDEMSGTGWAELPNGGVYEGRFRDGQADGHGTYVSNDGDVYQGTWIRGKANGVFLVTKADGSVEQQVWKDDERIEEVRP